MNSSSGAGHHSSSLMFDLLDDVDTDRHRMSTSAVAASTPFPQQSHVAVSSSSFLTNNGLPNTSSSDYYTKNVYPLVAQCVAEEQLVQKDYGQRDSQHRIEHDYPLAHAIPYNEVSSNAGGINSFASNSNMSLPNNKDEENVRHESIPTHINPDGSINKKNLPPKVLRFRQKRKLRTAASATAGVVVGAFALGPVGMVLGGVGGYAIAKKVGKRREKKLLEQCLDEQAGSTGSNWKSVGGAVSA